MEYLDLFTNIFSHNLHKDKLLDGYTLSIENKVASINIDDVFFIKQYIIDEFKQIGYETFSIDFLYNNSHEVLKFKNCKYRLSLSINIVNRELSIYTDKNILNGDSMCTIDLSNHKEDNEKIYLIDGNDNVICSVSKNCINDVYNNDLFINTLNSIIEFVINNKLKR